MRSLVAVLLAAAVGGAALISGCSSVVAGTASPEGGTACTVAAGPAGPLPPDDAFADGRGRFRLAPPRGWTADTSGAQGTAVIFLEPGTAGSAAGAFTSNINILVLPAAADLPATVIGARRELRDLAGYSATADRSCLLHDGTPAHLLGGTFDDPGTGVALRNLQLVVVAGASTVVVTGTSPTERWDAYETAFATSLQSLDLTGR